MSLEPEKKRFLAYVTGYKKSLPEPPEPEPAAGAGDLPNDASRAKGAIRTRERRYGEKKLTSEGSKTLSKPKK